MRIGIDPRISEATRDGFTEIRCAIGELLLRGLESVARARHRDCFGTNLIGLAPQDRGVDVGEGEGRELVREEIDHGAMFGADWILDGELTFRWDEANACGWHVNICSVPRPSPCGQEITRYAAANLNGQNAT
jgi:hypothetical protein